MTNPEDLQINDHARGRAGNKPVRHPVAL